MLTPIDLDARTPPPREIDIHAGREVWSAEKRGKVRLEAVAAAAARLTSLCLAEIQELEAERVDWTTVRGHLKGVFQRRAVEIERLETLLLSELP